MAESEEVVVEASNDVEETTEEVVANSNGYTLRDEYYPEDVVALEKELLKARKLIVEQKREAKANKQKADVESTTTEASYITKQELALEKFLDKNPEMEEYKEDIQKHTARGLSLQEAKLLVENSPALVNRKKTISANISHSEGGVRIQAEYSKKELSSLSDMEYDKIIPLIKSGKVRLT